MTAHVCSGPGVDAVLDAVDAARGSWPQASGPRPTLALAFASVEHDVGALARGLAGRGLAVVGATTAGEVAGADVLDRSCVVMLWAAEPGTFDVWAGARDAGGGPDGGPDGDIEAVARGLGRFAAGRFARPVVVALASGLGTDGDAVVRGVHDGAAEGGAAGGEGAWGGARGPLPLFGGLAGDDFRMEGTAVLTADGPVADGVVGLVLDGDRYDVAGVATGGWQPVGVEKAVTRSEGNVVHELDGEPVLDVYARYFDLGDLGSGPVAAALGVQYPLALRRPDGAVVVRAPLLADPRTGGLVFGGAVPEGARVRFCVPPSLDVVDRAVAEAAALRGRLPEADAVLVVSCKARHAAFGPMIEDEVGGLAAVWGAPLAGFFSYGEVGPQAGADGAGGPSDFHNETCTVLAVRERAASERAAAGRAAREQAASGRAAGRG